MAKLNRDVDFFLTHNRKIVNRCDDSVMRDGYIIRLSRGIAPKRTAIDLGKRLHSRGWPGTERKCHTLQERFYRHLPARGKRAQPANPRIPGGDRQEPPEAPRSKIRCDSPRPPSPVPLHPVCPRDWPRTMDLTSSRSSTTGRTSPQRRPIPASVSQLTGLDMAMTARSGGARSFPGRCRTTACRPS